MEDQLPGFPIVGILHSTDISAGAEVPLFNQGSNVARSPSVAVDEYIEIDSIQIQTAVTGDTHVFFSKDATPTTGATIVRATEPTSGSLLLAELLRTGQIGQGVWAKAAAGAFDVTFNGRVRKAGNLLTRAFWRESQIPGK